MSEGKQKNFITNLKTTDASQTPKNAEQHSVFLVFLYWCGECPIFYNKNIYTHHTSIRKLKPT